MKKDFWIHLKDKTIELLKSAHFWTALILIGMFGALIVNIVYFVAHNSYDVISDEHNPRQALLAHQNIRGNIASNDGSILAATNVSGNTETRIYPYGDLFAHVVGFSTMGKTGIENMMNMNLITSNASLSSKVDNDISKSKDRGDSVITTLDIELQKTAYDAIGYYKGAVVVSEVKTGKILAMVSKPCFDPNNIEEEWEDIVNDTKTAKLVNRATQGLYPPGSTFKILDLLEYVKEHPDNYENYGYQCNGRFNYDGRKITCFHGSVHGYQTLRSSFALSCNCSFANIGTTVDRKAFSETLKEMLFDSALPLDIEYSKSHTPITAEAEDWEVVQGSIGQGKTSVTPIHMNMITSCIANKGVLMKPMFVERIENSDGNIMKTYTPEVYKALTDEKSAAVVADYMRSVVTSGTATVLKAATYTSAGKTGSAEADSSGTSHAWFTGFAPYEDPEIAVTIIIEGAGTGGSYAVPMAKRIFDCYFEEKSQE
ncbi:MAG: penicillin-binding protein 2 [Lachnospiraceae bacterium]|nr:penicillin-binding protein 2 [Lachnospiraceae bacterium]